MDVQSCIWCGLGEGVCVRERECVFVGGCVFVRERERERESVGGWVCAHAYACNGMYVCVRM